MTGNISHIHPFIGKTCCCSTALLNVLVEVLYSATRYRWRGGANHVGILDKVIGDTIFINLLKVNAGLNDTYSGMLRRILAVQMAAINHLNAYCSNFRFNGYQLTALLDAFQYP